MAVERRAIRPRQPSIVLPKKRVATITNGVAVPRSNAKRRRIIPIATVKRTTVTPSTTVVSSFLFNRMKTRDKVVAMRNGAATKRMPLIPVSVL